MKNWIRNILPYVISRTTGTLSFIRFIEWAISLRWLKPKVGERILDVACGQGGLSLKIAKSGCKVYGIDISENVISTARRLSERANLASEFEVADAEHLPYADGYFDKIICSSSLEHFQDDVKALKEMNRVLKTNGILIMTVDSLSYPISERLKQEHKEKYHVVNYYDRDKLKDRLELSGFNLIQSKYLVNSPRVKSFK